MTSSCCLQRQLNIIVSAAKAGPSTCHSSRLDRTQKLTTFKLELSRAAVVNSRHSQSYFGGQHGTISLKERCRSPTTLLRSSLHGWKVTGWESGAKTSRQRQRQRVLCQAAQKTANLTACRMLTVPLPTYADEEGKPRHLSEFLKLPIGRETMLKGQSCKSKELIGDNMFRCYLRSIEAFNFSISPVIDVRVTSTDDTCTVEMLQCRFMGSEAVERQNDRFSASFRNHIDWREKQDELQNEIQLDLELEVFTPPFTFLPLAAIERPGSGFLQALLDRVAPSFVSSLLADYKAWAEGELDDNGVSSNGQPQASEAGNGDGEVGEVHHLRENVSNRI